MDSDARPDAVYDRQVRLWGAETQKRIREALILFIGVSLSSFEIMKNVSLTGSSLKFSEGDQDEAVTRFTAGQSTAKFIKEMAPKSEVTQIETNLEDIEIGAFSVVIIDVLSSGLSRDEILQIADRCDATGRPYFMLHLLKGPLGIVSLHLGRHVIEDLKGPDADGSNEEKIRKVCLYRTFRDIVENGPRPEASGKDLDEAAIMLMQAVRGDIRLPEDPNQLHKMQELVLGSGLTSSSLSESLFSIQLWPSMAAVVGGIVSNEIRKILSSVHEPINSAFITSSYSGTICRLL